MKFKWAWGGGWVDQPNLTTPNFTEVPASSRNVLGVSILPLSGTLVFDFGIITTVWYFLFFILFTKKGAWTHSLTQPMFIVNVFTKPVSSNVC